MRRQESFGMNAAKYGRPKLSRNNSSGSSNRSINTENDIDTYYDAIRGDTGFLCNDAGEEEDFRFAAGIVPTASSRQQMKVKTSLDGVF
eukprot:scaffold16708_cov80-Skeletonema_menzelii.AAC.2